MVCRETTYGGPAGAGRRERGFTLLETLIALIILSLASLAMMQSTGSVLRSSERALTLSQGSMEGFIERQIFRGLLHGLVMDWSVEERARFFGTPERIQALSTYSVRAGSAGVRPFTLQTRRTGQGRIALDLEREDGRYTLSEHDGRALRFQYLGTDRRWYDRWPPDAVPPTGISTDDAIADMPEWPVAIALRVDRDRAPGSQIVWIERIELPDVPPVATDDF